MKEFNITKEYECEIVGSVSKAHFGSPQTLNDPGSPDEPAEAELTYVGVIIKGASIDITSLLSERQREHFEAVLLERAADEEEREWVDLEENRAEAK